jgi:hypothetical protein
VSMVFPLSEDMSVPSEVSVQINIFCLWKGLVVDINNRAGFWAAYEGDKCARWKGTSVHKISTAHLQTCCYCKASHNITRFISDQVYTLWAPCPLSCTLHLVSNILRGGGVMWGPSMGASHRLPKPVSRQQLDKLGYHGNQQ